MDRTIVVQGELHVVACAVAKDGSSPAEEVLEEFASGGWRDDPDLEGVPDDAQISDYDLFLASMVWFADNGVPQCKLVGMNALDHGIWEFKIRRKRISFFDTDGKGTKFMPMKILDRDKAVDPDDDDFWHVPTFERHIRLGHCFGKRSQRAKPSDIRYALQIRWEDLEHDRKEADAR